MNDHSSRENFLSNLKRTGEVEITVTGRKTRKKFSAPVWFLLEGKDEKVQVVLVPIKGSDTNWFKNLEKDSNIELGIDGTKVASKATPVKDPNRAKQVIDKLKTKYKSEWSESYYTKRDAYVEVSV